MKRAAIIREEMEFPWRDSESGCQLFIRLQPRASKTCFMGIDAGRLKIKIMAPPVEGAANKALCQFLAQSLKVAPSRIQWVRGETGREKTVEVLGMKASEVKEKISVHLK